MTAPDSSAAHDSSDRVERERAFHDDRFGVGEGGTRARADGFYAVNLRCEAAYRQRYLAATAGARVLEYGCGVGGAAFDLGARGVAVTAIDISPVAIEVAEAECRRRALTTVEFREMNAEALDVPTSSFDLVCGSGILHHLDLDRAFAEVARVLRPQGRAVFLEPMGHNPVINLYRRFTPSMRTPDEHPLLMSDLDRFRQRFGRVDVQFYALTSLAALALKPTPWFDRARRFLDDIDAWLFCRLPGLRRYAWTVLIEVADPHR